MILRKPSQKMVLNRNASDCLCRAAVRAYPASRPDSK
jgi:hypothetical protein